MLEKSWNFVSYDKWDPCLWIRMNQKAKMFFDLRLIYTEQKQSLIFVAAQYEHTIEFSMNLL